MLGASKFEPLSPPLNDGLRNQKVSRNTASASVTTMKGSPRIRRAGNPTTTPMTVAISAARIGANGNGIPSSVFTTLNPKAPTPARVS